MTVISVDRSEKVKLIRHVPAEIWCILNLTVNSPVPKPSMPGMSSPKLKKHQRSLTDTCIHFFMRSEGERV